MARLFLPEFALRPAKLQSRITVTSRVIVLSMRRNGILLNGNNTNIKIGPPQELESIACKMDKLEGRWPQDRNCIGGIVSKTG
ncbi:hypothetical protein [Noviherbaspirillum sp.]|uniref:hypothetical protein n=1 Tax=Noviherbaspirillum sp. TaxID=1926288 RepID=UPI002B48BE8E|nr:hypothetical protein [Noviherbaspirillum sp.]HJV80985.1 hypothetical protein [Noviherbaspirillum sp.]